MWSQLLGLFWLLQASHIPWLIALHHSDLCLLHWIFSFSRTLTLLPPARKDPCDYIESTSKIWATLPDLEFLNLITPAKSCLLSKVTFTNPGD